jgi:hypothetical protein
MPMNWTSAPIAKIHRTPMRGMSVPEMNGAVAPRIPTEVLNSVT